MATLNIGGDPNDPSYRYKMPVIEVKIEGRGNGIKTIFLNINEIAKSLNRNVEYIMKWFGSELGSQSTINKDTNKNMCIYSINGCHSDLKKLQNILDQFIKKYVLCPRCKLPETYLTVVGSKIQYTCNACGTVKIYNEHKFDKFIIKNPPINPKLIVKKNNEPKEIMIKNEQIKNNEIESWSVDFSLEAVEKRRLENLSDVMKKIVY